MKNLFLIIIFSLILPFKNSSYAQEKEEVQREISASSFKTKDQNALANEIASKTDENYLNRGYLVMRYDTLGALVLGLSNKNLSFNAPVEFISYGSEKLSARQKRMFEDDIPQKGKVAEYNTIYPGFFVWIEDREGEETVILSINKPEDMQVLTLEEKKEEKQNMETEPQEEKKPEPAKPGSYFIY